MVDYDTPFLQNFRELSDFHDSNISYLLGRAFVKLQERGVPQNTIAECFDVSRTNIDRAKKIYKRVEKDKKNLK